MTNFADSIEAECSRMTRRELTTEVIRLRAQLGNEKERVKDALYEVSKMMSIRSTERLPRVKFLTPRIRIDEKRQPPPAYAVTYTPTSEELDEVHRQFPGAPSELGAPYDAK